jgi:hypothetical protein
MTNAYPKVTIADLTDLERWGLEDGFTTLEGIARERAGLSALRDPARAAIAAAASWGVASAADAAPAVPTTASAGRSAAAPRAASPDADDQEADPYACLTPAELEAAVRDRDEKFEDSDVTPSLRVAAEAWARVYAGDFEWVLKQQRLLASGRDLYEGTVRGLLNSWRAELRRGQGGAESRLDTEVQPPRVNRHPGTCLRCRCLVDAGAGTIRRAGDGWVVLCRDHGDPSVPLPSEVSAPSLPLPEVPGGRYAIARAGVLHFYRVDRPTVGSWAGRTFVAEQASDSLYPVRDQVAKGAVLRAIAEDPYGAAARYGQELGVCGRCGRTLTDATSRDLGIGPECRKQERWAA